MDNLTLLYLRNEERIEECGARADHGLPVTDATVRGVFIPHKAFCFLTTFRLHGGFNSIIMRGFSASKNFTIKRVPLILISTYPLTPFSSLPFHSS